MNVGRLRVAAKGVDRAEAAGRRSCRSPIEVQNAEDSTCSVRPRRSATRLTTIAELHRDISDGEGELLSRSR